MIALSVRVSRVSSQWLDNFIQVSVTCTLVVGQLKTRFGMDVNVLDKSINFFLLLLIP